MRRENLIAARKAAGLTQKALAEKLGVTLRNYQKIEYGKVDCNLFIWDAAEDILGKPKRVLRVID